MMVKCVKFSQNGRFWGAATTEGLYVYGQDEVQIFTPFELNENISSTLVYEEFQQKNYYNALIMALQLNDEKILQDIFINIPK